jgi:hypothetical protein
LPSLDKSSVPICSNDSIVQPESYKSEKKTLSFGASLRGGPLCENWELGIFEYCVRPSGMGRFWS